MAELEVKIGASIDGLEKGLKKAGKEVEGFNDEAKKASKETEKIGKSASSSVPSVSQLSSALKGNAVSLEDVGQAAFDAASGLASAKGGTDKMKAATDAATSSLGGTTGIAVALISLGAILIDYATDLNDATKNTIALREATKGFVGEAQTEITILNSLLSIARDESKTKEERERALSKINEEYGKYLPNLTAENVSTKEVTASLNTYTEALIRQAKIKGLQNRLSELFTKRYDEENKSIEENNSLLDKSIAFIQGVSGVNGQLAGAQFLAQQGAKKQAQAISEVDAEIKKLTGTIQNIISEDVSLSGIFTGTDETDTPATQIRNQISGVVSQLTAAKEVIKPLTDELRKDLILAPTPENVTEAQMRFSSMLLALQDFNNQANNLIGGGLTNAFAGIGDAIGSGLATGANVLESIGASLLGSLGAILIDLGKLAIQTGVGLLAVKLALKSLNPAVAIAAGVALVTLGSAFSKGAANISKNIGSGGGGATSSGVSGGTTTDFGSRSATPTSSFGGGTVVFEIQGTKLVGVLSNTLQRNRAIGGTLTIG